MPQGSCRPGGPAQELRTVSTEGLQENAGGLREDGGSGRWPVLTPEQRTLVARHRGLVGIHLRTKLPRIRWPTRTREYNDLFQEGCIALARAAAQYNPGEDGEFAAYALLRIRTAIYLAVHQAFTIIHVPMRARHKARHQAGEPADLLPLHIEELPSELEDTMPAAHRLLEPVDTIRHAVHRRYERAVRRTLEQMRGRHWRNRNPADILEKIVRDRLLVDGESQRTTLGRIAREFGVSTGRVHSYEKQFLTEVEAVLEADPGVRLLSQMAREDSDGMQAPMDEDRRSRLEQVELREFERRYSAMDPKARAELVYRLMVATSECVPEIARNLFRLALSADCAP